jgi:hypothetical protein
LHNIAGIARHGSTLIDRVKEASSLHFFPATEARTHVSAITLYWSEVLIVAAYTTSGTSHLLAPTFLAVAVS